LTPEKPPVRRPGFLPQPAVRRPPVRRSAPSRPPRSSAHGRLAVLVLLSAALFWTYQLREMATPVLAPSPVVAPEPRPVPSSRLALEKALADRDLANAALLIEHAREEGAVDEELEQAFAMLRQSEIDRLTQSFGEAEGATDLKAMQRALEQLLEAEIDDALLADLQDRLARVTQTIARQVSIADLWQRFRGHRERGDFWQAEADLRALAALGQEVNRELAALVMSVRLADGVALRFRWIPPGTFLMGSPPGEAGRNDDEVRHEVRLTEGFWLSETELSQGQLAAASSLPLNFAFPGDENPVENINRAEIDEILIELSKAVSSGSFRLPSEAEWEYACRAGSETAFHFGDRITADRANFDASEPYGVSPVGPYRQRPMPVRSLEPNRWGLFHMHGNVWEHCMDRYAPYGPGPREDPVVGLSLDRFDFVVRGGGWGDYGQTCRSASRFHKSSKDRSSTIGLRLVFVPEGT